MPTSKRKRQARLTFTPIPSSSPATKGYNKQIQDRAAAVSYNGSPSPAKRQKRMRQAKTGANDDALDAAQVDGVNDAFPTPAATMDRRRHQLSDGEEDDESDEPIAPTQRRSSANAAGHTRSKRARQQALDFSGARDANTFSSPVRLSSPPSVRSSGRGTMFSSQNKRKKNVVDDSSDESDARQEQGSGEELSTKSREKVGKKRRTVRTSQKPVLIDSDDEQNEAVAVSEKAASEDEDDEDDEIPLPSTQRRKRIQQRRESTGLEGLSLASQPAVSVQPVNEVDDESNEEMPTTTGRQKRKARRARSNSFISSSPPRMLESDDELEIVERPRPRQAKESHGDEPSGSDEDIEVARPSRLRRGKYLTRQDEDDLAEDLDFLGPSSDVEALNRTPRNTQSRQKEARLAALDRLKLKRSGQPQPAMDTVDEDDEEDDHSEGIPTDDGGDSEIEEIMPYGADRRQSTRDMFREDEDDVDFIEEGDEDVLGVPDGVPIEFTHYARQKAKDLFKYAVEWMVQKKINPAFQIKDEVYDLAFRKLDDEVKGLAGSKFTSAAWTPDFTTSLKSRPQIAFEPIDRGSGEHWMRDKCDACNRSGHPATFEIQFHGKPYHPHTLEEVGGNDDDDDEDSSSSSDDEQPDYDHIGREIPAAGTMYYVGKFCMANAETAHALSHWRYHLNEWVIEWLTKEGYLTAERLVKRDRMSTKKRRKEANRIADRMENEGVVRQLWRDFRQNVEQAREAKQGRFSVDSP